MKFIIDTLDRDTRGVYSEDVYLDSVEQAEDYCERESWEGGLCYIDAVIICGVRHEATPEFLRGLKVGLQSREGVRND